MSHPNDRNRAKNKSLRKTTPLGLEQLEARMMNAVSGIQQNLQLLIDPQSLGSTQIVSTNVNNAAPTIRTALRLASGTEVRGLSTVLMVSAADDQGEAGLTYTWAATRRPVGGEATFALNGNNEAKRNTVTFNKAGTYSFTVTIRDAAGLSTTSSLQVNVTQTLTALQFTLADGTPITTSQSVSTASHTVKLRGVDQFGNTMTTLPEITWSRQSGPASGNATARLASGNATITFTRAGNYVIRAKNGNVQADVQFNVAQTLTSIGVKNAENKAITSSQISTTVNLALRWSATALDQFGLAMTQQPQINWSTAISPVGSNPTSKLTGNELSVQFDRSGSYTFRAEVGALRFNVPVNVTSVLTRIAILDLEGVEVSATQTFSTGSTLQRFQVRGFDQFGNSMSTLPSLTWTNTKAPTGGRASTGTQNGITTVTFTRVGAYTMTVKGGNTTRTLQFNVLPTFTSVVAVNASGATIPAAGLTVASTSVSLRALARDQFGITLAQQPTLTWSVDSVPTEGVARISASTNSPSVTFNRAGSYTLRAGAGNLTTTVVVNVTQQLTRLVVTPTTASVAAGETQQLTATGTDQFQQPMSRLPALTWSTTGGRVSSTGLFTAGTTAGRFTVTVRSGNLTAQATLTVTAATPTPTPTPTPSPESLDALITRLNSDDSITRAEMIQILRSAGDDGSVSLSELNRLRSFVSTEGGYKMPSYVRELAKDVVNSNPANLKFKGTTAGNLAAGSSSTLLNNLIDKWFLGADEPVISGSGISYQIAAGALFGSSLAMTDAKQGYLGDCYFISAVTSIASANADAIRNMFIDNGDGTFTVRFFGSGADYVTVNRKLPTLANGTLAYAGLGQAVSNASSILWVSLAEKAYAQWNETGNSGRNGTNTYSALEGGWMSNVNRQVLGFNSTNYALSSTSKQTLINSLGSGRAVTIGTNGTVGSGLVGSHAYTITGYNASTDRFTLYNPWGNTHPNPLSYDQLVANCSSFVVTQATGTSPISTLSVRSSLSDTFIGNWTTVEVHPCTFDAVLPIASQTLATSSVNVDVVPEMAPSNSMPTSQEWITLNESDDADPTDSLPMESELQDNLVGVVLNSFQV
jgi:hypothetical protein